LGWNVIDRSVEALTFSRVFLAFLVRLAGISQGALFKHFPSKTELLSAAIQRLFGAVVDRYQPGSIALTKGSAAAEAAFEMP